MSHIAASQVEIMRLKCSWSQSRLDAACVTEVVREHVFDNLVAARPRRPRVAGPFDIEWGGALGSIAQRKRRKVVAAEGGDAELAHPDHGVGHLAQSIDEPGVFLALPAIDDDVSDGEV